MGITVRAEPASGTWAAREEAVLAQAEAFARSHVEPEWQRRLLTTELAGLREATAGSLQPPAYIHLAPLVYAGLWGDEGPAHPLAAAMTLLFAGLDLLDGLAGRNQSPRWAGYHPAEMAWGAAPLLCALPQLAVASLAAPPVVLSAMQETLAHGLVYVTARRQPYPVADGLKEDIVQHADALVAGTAGEEAALYTALGAQLGGASPRVVDACRQLGRAIGAGGQIAADCHDVFHAQWSKQLAGGTYTLPVALHAARLQGEDRQEFMAVLDRARVEAAAQTAVRARLLAAGELRLCAQTIEECCRRAKRALAMAGLLEPARGLLWELIAAITMHDEKESCDEKA